jgi:hypothetical protein
VSTTRVYDFCRGTNILQGEYTLLLSLDTVQTLLDLSGFWRKSIYCIAKDAQNGGIDSNDLKILAQILRFYG